jgi:hypothetical protein
VIGRVREFRRSCKSVRGSVSVAGCSTSRSSTDLTSVFSVFLQLARKQLQDNDSGDDETSCCLKTLARKATYALPRSIPLHPPLFADTNLICLHVSGYAAYPLHFTRCAGEEATQEKSNVLIRIEPFSVGYQAPGSMVTKRRQTHDEPCAQDEPAPNTSLPKGPIRL